MRPIEIEKLKEAIGNLDIVKTDTVFLNQINKCDLFSLFLLNDGKEHFYIKEPDGNYEELIYKIYINESTRTYELVYKTLYRNQLEKYIIGRSNYESLKRKLEVLKYNEDELSSFVSQFSSTKNVTETSKTKFTFFTGGGISLSDMKIKGQTNLADHTFSNSISPLFLVGVDLFSNKNLGALIFRTQVSYSSMKFSSSYYRNTSSPETYNLQMNNINPSVALLYSFIRRNNYRVYGGLQIGYAFS